MIVRWTVSCRFDSRGAALADRHYSRRTVGSPQFVPPGRSLILVVGKLAVWASLDQEHQDMEWAPSWLCTIFRNEGAGLSSELIREALAATRHAWGEPPERWGMITFVDPKKVKSTNPGCCFKLAGFELVGETEGGHGRNPLLVFSCPPERWPDPAPAIEQQLALGLGR